MGLRRHRKSKTLAAHELSGMSDGALVNHMKCHVIVGMYENVQMFPKAQSHNGDAARSSVHKRASSDMMSDSARQCETACCLLHIQEIGTNVCGPNTHNFQPDVGFEPYKSCKTCVLKQPKFAILNFVCHKNNTTVCDVSCGL